MAPSDPAAVESALCELDDRLCASEPVVREALAYAGATLGISLDGVDDTSVERMRELHQTAPDYSSPEAGVKDGARPRLQMKGVLPEKGKESEGVHGYMFKLEMNIRMCEQCCKVAPKKRIPLCKGCGHAAFCSTECFNAAWPTHKPRCRHIQDMQTGKNMSETLGDDNPNYHYGETDSINTGDRWLKKSKHKQELLASLEGHLYIAKFLWHDALRIDNPRLCTFWLEAVVHGLPRASALELRLPLTVLQAWLWFYTFAAVPAWLRRTLVLNLRRVTAQLFTRARPPHWAACPFADLLRHRLGSAGEWECVRDRKHHDPGYTEWYASMEGELTSEEKPSAAMRQYMQEALPPDFWRNIVLGSLSQMTQDEFNFPARAFWHPARVLEMHAAPRGHALAASAAGFHVHKDTVEWLVAAWAGGARDAPPAAPRGVHAHWLADFNLGNSHRVYGWRIPAARRLTLVTMEPAAGELEYHDWFPAFAVREGAGASGDRFRALRTRGARLPVLTVHKRTPEDGAAHFASELRKGPEPKRGSGDSMERMRQRGGAFAALADAGRVVTRPLYAPSAGAPLTELEKMNQRDVEAYAGQAREYGVFVVP